MITIPREQPAVAARTGAAIDTLDTYATQIEIAARIAEGDEEVMDALRAAAPISDAFDPQLRLVISAALEIDAQGNPVNLTTLYDAVASTSAGQETFEVFNAAITRRLPNTESAEALVERIAEVANMRRVRSEVVSVAGYVLNAGATLEGAEARVDTLSALITSYVNRAETSGEPVRRWPELDREHALYGLAGEIVKFIEPETEADPVALLVQLLAYFGNAIGRHAYFRAESHRHYGALFVALVGDTAKARKGTSESQIERVFTTRDEHLEAWRTGHLLGGLTSGEGLIHAVRDPVGDDGVSETDLMRDKRALIRESEFGATLRTMNREGNSLSGVVRDAWDGRTLRTMGKRAPETATGAHISIVGHVTRDELMRYLSATDSTNGFGNRFLWCAVRRAQLLPEGGALDDESLDPFREALASAVRTAQMRGELKRDAPARALWHDIYEDLSAGALGLFGAMTARAEAQTMRLALLYALLDEACEIKGPHLEAALAVWRYCENSARYLFGDKATDPVEDTILDGLRAAGVDGLTRTQISQLLGRNRAAEQIEQALGRLRELGLADCERVAPNGRTIVRWYSVRTTKTTKTTKTTPFPMASLNSPISLNSYFVCPQCGGAEHADYGDGPRCVICDWPMTALRTMAANAMPATE